MFNFSLFPACFLVVVKTAWSFYIIPWTWIVTLCLNDADANVHGILLQHPVPGQIDERACFDAISLAKDVDGVTCLGYGRMAMGEEAYGCATPKGIMRLLEHYQIHCLAMLQQK